MIFAVLVVLCSRFMADQRSSQDAMTLHYSSAESAVGAGEYSPGRKPGVSRLIRTSSGRGGRSRAPAYSVAPAGADWFRDAFSPGSCPGLIFIAPTALRAATGFLWRTGAD